MSHQIQKKNNNNIEFHMDFCFPGDAESEGHLTILVIRERQTRMMMASVVPSKSTGDFIVRRGASFIKEIGCSKGVIVTKSDQEPAMKAIVDGIVKQRAADGLETNVGKLEDQPEETLQTRAVPENSPVGSSQSDGVVERAIQSLEAQMRVMRDALE